MDRCSRKYSVVVDCGSDGELNGRVLDKLHRDRNDIGRRE